MIIEKIGCYEILLISEKGKEFYYVDSGKYVFLKRFNKFILNKKRIYKKFDTLSEAKEFAKKKVKGFVKRKTKRIAKLPKSLYLVLLKEKKTKITFVKVGFTSKKFIISRFSKEHGYEDYELVKVIRRIESPNTELMEENIKNELKKRMINKYRPILESFSGYSECFDIVNLELIIKIFDEEVTKNQ